MRLLNTMQVCNLANYFCFCLPFTRYIYDQRLQLKYFQNQSAHILKIRHLYTVTKLLLVLLQLF